MKTGINLFTKFYQYVLVRYIFFDLITYLYKQLNQEPTY